MENNFRSGFVSIIGKTNVGKSTLMNRFIGEKISAISNKPQTTRNRILSVLTDNESQIIFLDTPGVHKPKSKLSEFMLKTVDNALNEVDMVLFLIEPEDKVSFVNQNILEKLKKISSPIFLVINKIDSFSKDRGKILKTIENYKGCGFREIIPVSALTGENVEDLMNLIKNNLPCGPKYFPDDTLTDMPERQIISEIIREKILIFMEDEIPHGSAVEINEMKKRAGKNLIDIDATIYCEKESHKKIIIGKNGEMLKKIGTCARFETENLLGTKLNLKLWVKMKKNWRNNNFYLKQFGYTDKK